MPARVRRIALRLDVAVPLVLFALPFTVYLMTLAPTITWRNDGADSGELVTAAYVLGIPHPPGYPLYVLLGRLFAFLPAGDIAYRVNLMSAFFAGATVGVLYLAGRRLLSACFGDAGRPLGGYLPVAAAAAAGLFFAFSPTLWSQATIAEVYTLNAFCVAVILYLLLAGHPPPRLALVYGLSLTNHGSMLLLAPMVLLSSLQDGPPGAGQLRRWSGMVGTFLLGLTPYAWLPWRARQHPPLNWGAAHTWAGFQWLVSGRLYWGFSLALPWAAVPARIAAWAQLLLQQFTWAGLLLGLVGLWVYWQIDRLRAAVSLLCFGLIVAYALGYNTTDSYVYLIPAYLIFALWLALGTFYLLSLVASRGEVVLLALVAGVLLVSLAGLVRHYASQDLSDDWTAYQYAWDAFAVLERESILVTATDPQTFALWYFAYVLKPEVRVAVVNRTLLHYRWYRHNLREVHPQVVLPGDNGSSADLIGRLVEANMGHHPIYLSYQDWATYDQYGVVRAGPLYRVAGSGLSTSGPPP